MAKEADNHVLSLELFQPNFTPPDHMYHKCPLAWGFTSKTLWMHCWTASLWVLPYSISTQCWSHKVSLLLALPKRKKLYLPVKSVHFTIFTSEIWVYIYIAIQVSTNLTLLHIFTPPSQHSLAAGKNADLQVHDSDQGHHPDVGDCKLATEMTHKTSNYLVQGPQLPILK